MALPKIYILLLLILGTLARMWSQDANYRKIDKYALQAPESTTESFADLAGYLIKSAQNDFEKARAIYTWIATHIQYDQDRYNKNDLSIYAKINIGEDALLYRKSICAGFAQFFQALAEYAGLECEVIEGYARRPQDIGTSFAKINHAWNAVKLQDKWYLLDVTWGVVDSIRTVNNLYDNPAFEFYFLTDPDKFVFTHFPKNTKWLLSSESIDKRTFEHLPFLYPASGTTLESVSTQTGVIRTKGQFSVELAVKYGGTIQALVVDYKGRILSKEVTIDYTKKNATRIIEVNLQAKGAYLLEVFYETDLILVYKILSQ